MISIKKKKRNQSTNSTEMNKFAKAPLKILKAIEKHAAKYPNTPESNENKSTNRSKVKYENLNELLKDTEVKNNNESKKGIFGKLSNKKKSQKADHFLIEKTKKSKIERPMNGDKLKNNVKRLDTRRLKNFDNSSLKNKSELIVKKSKNLAIKKLNISEKPTDELKKNSENMIFKSNNLKQSSLKKSNELNIKNLNENEKINLKRGKISKDAKKQKKKIMGNLELTKQHVEKTVDVILQLTEKQKQEQKSLFSFEDNPIFMQINCIKIPKVSRRRIRLSLPYDMIGPNDDVALFVPDLEKGRRQDIEKTVEHWESILREKGVTKIKSIIPMTQVKNEYNQFEMRRKLARLHDLFLVDARIAGHMCHLLGSTFTRFSKAPIPLRLYNKDLKSEIENAMKRATLEIHGRGPCHTVQVATLSMTPNKIVRNILAACEKLKAKYPGGFDNIRSILIKTKLGLGIPIYYSIKSRDKVPVPTLKPLRPKAYITVEGELTTVESDVKVSVTPTGKVTVIPIKNSILLKEDDSNDDETTNMATNETKKRTLTESPFEQVETVNKHKKKKNDKLISKADTSVKEDDKPTTKLKKEVKNTKKKGNSASIIVNGNQNTKAMEDITFDKIKKRKIDLTTENNKKVDRDVKIGKQLSRKIKKKRKGLQMKTETVLM